MPPLPPLPEIAFFVIAVLASAFSVIAVLVLIFGLAAAIIAFIGPPHDMFDVEISSTEPTKKDKTTHATRHKNRER